MKVFLDTLFPKKHIDEYVCFAYRCLLASANINAADHQIVNDAAAADIIIFCDAGPLPCGLSLLQNSLFRRFPWKCFVYDAKDEPNYWYRGFPVSGVKDRCSTKLHRGAAYINNRSYAGSKQLVFPESETHLFSFCGATETHSVRKIIKNLFNHTGCIFDVPRSVTQTAAMAGDSNTMEFLYFKLESICKDSLFVLCPRGYGVSSMRIFEAMSMGRAPVIISDSWIPPFGPVWSEFSIRIKECEVSKLPQVLEARRHQAFSMGYAARAAFEQWFSLEHHFTTTIDACIDILEKNPSKSWSKTMLLSRVFSHSGLRLIARRVRRGFHNL